MLRYFVILSLIAIFSFANPATREDIRELTYHIDNRFDSMQLQMDKRFEAMQKQMDERFNQVEKRIAFLENVAFFILGIVVITPFGIEYFARRRSAEDRARLEMAEKAIIVLKELAKTDPKVAEALKIVGVV